ncbi:CHAP domain-containing protein [Streptomyces griseosporeus]|uniref:CHAP domain-containing protein n=1 Tax=Streptomyces griseosporeus TaxID=1910 RepID=UPI0036FBA7DA
MVRKTTSLVLALAAGSAITMSAAPAASAATAQDLVRLSEANFAKGACSTNSYGEVGFYSSCTGAGGHPEAWCADYAKWLWAKTGAQVDGLTASAGSFYLYGQNKGTLHTDLGYVPKVGDAVVFDYAGGGWATHVGVVVQVYADRTVQISNGNYGDDASTSTVSYSKGYGQVGRSVFGQTISAFVSPVGLDQTAPAPATPPRVLAVQNGVLYAQQGGPQTDWTRLTENVKAYKASGDRIGVLNENNQLLVKEGDLQAGWSKIADDVVDFDLDDDTIGVLQPGNVLRTKTGGLDAQWHTTNGVTAFDLDTGRVGVTTTDGAFKVQEGGLDASWASLTENVSSFDLDGGRIGVLRGTTLYVKHGGLTERWYETTGVSRFSVSGNRVLAEYNGKLVIQEDGPQSTWKPVADAPIGDFEASGDRIGLLQNGNLYVKTGAYDGPWYPTTNISGFDLS